MQVSTTPFSWLRVSFCDLGKRFKKERKSVVAEDFRGCAGIVWGGHRGGEGASVCGLLEDVQMKAERPYSKML